MMHTFFRLYSLSWCYIPLSATPWGPEVGGVLLVGLMEVWGVMSIWNPAPGTKWCLCWWLLWPHSRNHTRSFLCLQTHFCTLFFLHWMQLLIASKFAMHSVNCLCCYQLFSLLGLFSLLSPWALRLLLPRYRLHVLACPCMNFWQQMGPLCMKLWLYNMKIKNKQSKRAKDTWYTRQDAATTKQLNQVTQSCWQVKRSPDSLQPRSWSSLPSLWLPDGDGSQGHPAISGQARYPLGIMERGWSFGWRGPLSWQEIPSYLSYGRLSLQICPRAPGWTSPQLWLHHGCSGTTALWSIASPHLSLLPLCLPAPQTTEILLCHSTNNLITLQSYFLSQFSYTLQVPFSFELLPACECLGGSKVPKTEWCSRCGLTNHKPTKINGNMPIGLNLLWNLAQREEYCFSSW